jgi:hypothetical protein
MHLLGFLLLLAQAFTADFFETKIRPLFVSKCYQCHSTKVKMAGLNLADESSFRAVVPNPVHLLAVLSYDGKVKMPPSGKLEAGQLRLVEEWVNGGAQWPNAPAPATGATSAGARQHWSFQPRRRTPPPVVRNEPWVRKPLDRYILAALEKSNLQPASPADRATLLRRLSYNLTGLPPTPAELDDFLNDSADDALNRVVDRLLSSPRYGEKWGRHWLDVARYADSTGMDEDHLYPHAWRYRDYVVSAFNSEKPFDRFIVEQLAGDLLPNASNETRIATGFLAVGPKPLAQQDRVQMIYDVVDEQIDTTSKAFLGLSVSCARCHDHKFDPILTRDYYSLASIFASTRAFRNLGRPGAVSYLYYTSLDPEASSRYDLHRRQIDQSFIAAEEALAEHLCARNPAMRAQLPDYLAAAYDVRTKGRTNRPVDWSLLEKFLCLDGLKIWDEANDGNIETLARLYADSYESQAHQWDERLARWLSRYKEEVIQDRDRPAKPVFDPVDDPFFHALTFQGGPFDVPEPPSVQSLRSQWEKLKNTLPAEPPLASAVADGPLVEQPVFVRGSHHNRGPIVPKAFPIFLAGSQPPAVAGSGRLELARWIASADNPLTARVIVNRVWQWHFGEGLMRTPNNWGITGDKPTHPELLDYLAESFVASGWSLKWLHREILLSATYAMSSHASEEARAKDPGNRLWSRFLRRRMSVEEMRDSLLALDETLDPALGGSLLSPDRRNRRQSFDEITRRTLYLPVRRGSIPTLLSVFDYGDASTSNDGRSRTNVALQALFFRNSPFVQSRARGLASRLASAPTPADRVRQAYRLALGREPAPAEVDQALTFLETSRIRLGSEAAALASYCRVLLASNEFLYLN